jgi:hypothetical protein
MPDLTRIAVNTSLILGEMGRIISENLKKKKSSHQKLLANYPFSEQHITHTHWGAEWQL